MQKLQQCAGGLFSPVPTIIFPNWREMLNQASLSGAARGGYTLAISNYLEYCRLNRVSVMLFFARREVTAIRVTIQQPCGLWLGWLMFLALAFWEA